jgi:hypothetical protein
MALPKANLNPFAIIQPNPSAWQGLVGKTSSGFLTFQSAMYGVRAGFINLINTYLNRGLDTIEKIFPVYAPAGHGNNIPSAYIASVERLTGIARNQKIESEQDLYKIGKAIVQVEEGTFWVNQKEFDDGFKLAVENKNFKKAAVVASSGVGILLLIGFITYLVISNSEPKSESHNDTVNG